MPGRAPTSADLVALMQAGDLAALDLVARQYGQTLLAVARRRCHLAADAEDAVQQALITASAAMTTIRAEGSPVAWLSTLVSRQCHRMNEHAQKERAEGATDLPCTCDDPAALAEQRQLSERLSDALMGLPRTDRLLIMLSTQGFTSLELGEQLGLTSNAVRSRLKRARAHLRASLTPADTLEPLGSTAEANPTPGVPPHAGAPPQTDR